MRAACEQQQRSNAAMSEEVDAILLERAEREREAQVLEEAAAAAAAAAAARVEAAAGAAAAAEFCTLTAETRELRSAMAEQQQLLASAHQQVEAARATEAGGAGGGDEADAAEAALALLVRERADLEAVAAGSTEGLAAAAAAAAAAPTLEAELAAQLEANEAARRLVAELAAGRGGGEAAAAGERQKYALLLQRDEEMSAFLAGFQAAKGAELAAQRHALSRAAGAVQELGEDSELAAVDACDDDAGVGAGAGAGAAALAARRAELDKLAALEPKLAAEIAALRARAAAAAAEMPLLADVAGLRRAAAAAAADTAAALPAIVRRRDDARTAAAAAAADVERARAELAAEPQAPLLDAAEATPFAKILCANRGRGQAAQRRARRLCAQRVSRHRRARD